MWQICFLSDAWSSKKRMITPQMISTTVDDSGVTGGGGGRVPPETSDREISADLPGKERQGK